MDTQNASEPGLLILDDDPLIIDSLSFVLGKGYNVRAAASGAQVKSLLRQLDAAPELASVDLGLPPTPKRRYVEAALDIARGTFNQAATRLGIHRTILYSRLQYHPPGMEEES